TAVGRETRWSEPSSLALSDQQTRRHSGESRNPACWRHDDRRLSPSPLWGGWRQPGGGGRRHSARYSPTRPLRGHPPHKGRENSGHTPAKELIPSPPPRRILSPSSRADGLRNERGAA